jgi:hypothetical protein
MIAYRINKNRPGFPNYVANLPGDGGKDWGYTGEYRKAIRLSPYWQRRFRSDVAYCGDICVFVDYSGVQS